MHALFLSEHDIPGALRRSRDLLSFVPMIAVTSGWRGLSLVTRDGVEQVPGFPRTEVDPTGAGDVFAAAFLMRYQETGNPSEAAVFACCAASCVVEGVATTTLGDRAEIMRRGRDARPPDRGRRMGGVARERFERMRESVRALYDRNRQRGHAAWCGYDYDFVCPSMGTYPFQWFWDSCFHTVALSHFDRERARARCAACSEERSSPTASSATSPSGSARPSRRC